MEAPKWHNLLEDPTDLPKVKYETYIVARIYNSDKLEWAHAEYDMAEYKGIKNPNDAFDSGWYKTDENGYDYNVYIEAWQEIVPLVFKGKILD